MLSLFRNSKLSSSFHIFALAVSWSAVAYWLHFSFIQHNFLGNVISGQALLVDLIFGLPIVLIFSIVVYAFFYWLVKFLVIVFLPHTIIDLTVENVLEDTLDPELGEDYWKENADKKTKSDKKSSRYM